MTEGRVLSAGFKVPTTASSSEGSSILSWETNKDSSERRVEPSDGQQQRPMSLAERLAVKRNKYLAERRGAKEEVQVPVEAEVPSEESVPISLEERLERLSEDVEWGNRDLDVDYCWEQHSIVGSLDSDETERVNSSQLHLNQRQEEDHLVRLRKEYGLSDNTLEADVQAEGSKGLLTDGAAKRKVVAKRSRKGPKLFWPKSKEEKGREEIKKMMLKGDKSARREEKNRLKEEKKRLENKLNLKMMLEELDRDSLKDEEKLVFDSQLRREENGEYVSDVSDVEDELGVVEAQLGEIERYKKEGWEPDELDIDFELVMRGMMGQNPPDIRRS